MAVRCGHCRSDHPTPYDVYLCSRNARTSQRRSTIASPDPWGLNTFPLSIPESMVKAIRDGRYAVDVGRGERQKVIFVRVARPNHGKRKGCLLIQTQHSDDLRDALVCMPSGAWRLLTSYKDDLNMALGIIAVNPLDAAILYAKELDRCCRCGKSLTDERSRHYHIGPECEKHFPDLIIKIDETEGPWFR